MSKAYFIIIFKSNEIILTIMHRPTATAHTKHSRHFKEYVCGFLNILSSCYMSVGTGRYM